MQVAKYTDFAHFNMRGAEYNGEYGIDDIFLFIIDAEFKFERKGITTKYTTHSCVNWKIVDEYSAIACGRYNKKSGQITLITYTNNDLMLLRKIDYIIDRNFRNPERVYQADGQYLGH